ncbi:hypothetical protein C8Q76DRAFT_729540 [Earliella scabrosa]|nr:hypothetical protein C8Q76DRAFT_729540 [Earliella scabrosa]
MAGWKTSAENGTYKGSTSSQVFSIEQHSLTSSFYATYPPSIFTMGTRYNNDLNNYLQRQGQLAALHWGEEQVGPPGQRAWQMTCFINGEQKGVGIAAQKGAAKDLAAREALVNLGLLTG